MFRTPAVIGQEFAFAHGRTGVLQQSLVRQSDIDRLLGAHSRKEAEQILTELRFTKEIDQGIRESDAILNACNAWMREEVEAMCSKEKQDVFSILWMAGDQPLLCYLIKEKKGLTSDISRRPSAPYSAFDDEMLRALVMDNAEGTLPSDVIAFTREMIASEAKDSRAIDTQVASFFAKKKLTLAKKSDSNAILRYVQHTIDIHNIRTVLRFAEKRDDATMYLIEGGTVKITSLNGDDAHLAAQIRQAGLYEIADAVDAGAKDRSQMERLFSDVLAEDISVMWNTILRVEPLFAFAATALNQLALLRVIMIGKRNNLGPQEIKRVLPPFLSASHYVL